jgi:muramoyltetrapeptide carboxypeptidase
MIRPPRLRQGSRVALIAPASPVADDRFAAALDRCRRLGLEAVPGTAARSRFRGYLSGTDDARHADFEEAIGAPGIAAIWALRGGYGTMRLLPRLDLTPLTLVPKPFIGFSDNTAVHLALHARGVVSFHGPHAGGELSELSERCLQRVLFDPAPAGMLELPAGRPAERLHGGVAEGPLMGGNLALLAAMCGTPAQPSARDHILFLEDIGEEPYRLDRLWTQLVLAGALDGVRAVALGRFTDCGDDAGDLLAALCAPLDVPVLAGLPIGHEPDNWTLPLGVMARLDADAGTLELLAGAVTCWYSGSTRRPVTPARPASSAAAASRSRTPASRPTAQWTS